MPETCEIQVDRRVVPGEDRPKILPALERLLDSLREEDPNLNVSISTSLDDAPLDPDGNEAFIDFVRETLGEMSLPNEPEGVGYATDASNLVGAGIAVVVLGPGDIAQAHTCDEWLELDQLHLAVEVYLNLMRAKGLST